MYSKRPPRPLSAQRQRARALAAGGRSRARLSDSRRDIVLAAVMKMAAMPLLAYAISRWGFGLTGHHLFAQVVIAALPTAQNVLVYATRYQRGEVLARDSALVTTLLSIPVIALAAVTLA